jgi:penicillin-binding protein 1C
MKKIKSPFADLFLKAFLIITVISISYKIIMMLSLVIFPLPQKISGFFSKAYYYNDGVLCYISLNEEHQYRVYDKLNDIPDYVKKGVVEYEDRCFYFHPGFNPVAILRAFVMNFVSGKILSGGSTITMQVARLSEPKKRSVINKFRELLRTVQIEYSYGKDKILELYLNMIPMGGNIEGIGAASFFYFGKNPSDLTFSESCLLLSISNSPNNNRPDRFPDKALLSRNKVARRIHLKFGIPTAELNGILSNSGVPSEKSAFNYDVIPLIEKYSSLPFKYKRQFTVDRSIQNMCLNILKDKMSLQKTINGSVMVIDNTTMKVIAYIGSPYYYSGASGVKFNACNIRRSPGSSLKPFIYGRAFESGIISQKQKIPDIPRDFYGYKPKNFSNNYFGVISCDEALYRSLNIPAIYLESKLGDNGIRSVLRNAGLISYADAPEKKDLSVALGSFPLTLENMTGLYASLANKGIYKKPVFFTDETAYESGRELLSPEASFIISEILAESYRPDLNSSWEFTKDKPKVAYKTGTSYGYVDAWALGYTPKYTIGVWMGNLDNRFTRILTGIGDSSPVLFRIMDELCRYTDEWFSMPHNVAKRKVCAVSGMTPGKFCSSTVDEYYIKGGSSSETCNVHRRVIIDRRSGRIVPLEKIVNDGNYQEKVIEVWPEEVEYFFTKYGKRKYNLGEGNYSDIATDNPLKIISPTENVSFLVDTKRETKFQKIPLSAYGFPDSKYFYWYANNIFLGKSRSDDQYYYLPDEKDVEISVIDEMGRTGSVKIKVNFKN